MTTPNGNIIFNASTGSDTHASGLGPAIAVTLDITTSAGNSTASVSAFPAGSGIGDLVYIPSATGRKFNIIAGSNQQAGLMFFDEPWDDSLTDAPAYIGGKRATLDNADSRRLTSGESPQTWIELETDQTITSGLGQINGYVRIKSSGTDKKTIAISGSGEKMFVSGKFTLYNLRMIAYDNNAFAYSAGYFETLIRTTNCIIGDPDYPFSYFASNGSSGRYDLDSTILTDINPSGDFNEYYGTFQYVAINNCIFKNCGRIFHWGAGGANKQIKNTIFIGPGGTTCFYGQYQNFAMFNCVFYNYDYIGVGGGGGPQTSLNNCILHTITNVSSSTPNHGYYYNNYYYNVSNINQVVSIELENDMTQLTEDPFIDVENGDFNLNDKAGGGAVIKAAQFNL